MTPIWQQEGWPNHIKWSVKTCLPALTRARVLQGRLTSKVEWLGLSDKQRLRADALSYEAQKTSDIEGERVELDAVRSSVAERLALPHAGVVPQSRQMDGLVEMILDAATNPEDVTKERLFNWHAGLFPSGRSGIRPITVAAFREGGPAVQVVSGGLGAVELHYEALPSSQVAEQMSQLLVWWEESRHTEDGLLRAAWAHLWFVTIHPFDDGNGRIGRAIADLALTQSAGGPRLWFLSTVIRAQRESYYEELKRAQQGDGDITLWMVWFIECVCDAIVEAESVVDRVLQKANFWRLHQGVLVNTRQRKGLNKLLDAGPEGFVGGMTTKKWCALNKTSAATAQRDLADLVRKGLLQGHARGRNAYYLLVLVGEE